MGNWKAVPRKKRNHPAILASAQPFSDALHNGDYEKAAKIVFKCALEVQGAKGLMNAMHNANSFWTRRKYRRGLD